MRRIDSPIISSALKPKMRSALAFQLVTVPSSALPTMASSDDPTIAARRASDSWACLPLRELGLHRCSPVAGGERSRGAARGRRRATRSSRPEARASARRRSSRTERWRRCCRTPRSDRRNGSRAAARARRSLHSSSRRIAASTSFAAQSSATISPKARTRGTPRSSACSDRPRHHRGEVLRVRHPVTHDLRQGLRGFELHVAAAGARTRDVQARARRAALQLGQMPFGGDDDGCFAGLEPLPDELRHR